MIRSLLLSAIFTLAVTFSFSQCLIYGIFNGIANNQGKTYLVAIDPSNGQINFLDSIVSPNANINGFSSTIDAATGTIYHYHQTNTVSSYQSWIIDIVNNTDTLFQPLDQSSTTNGTFRELHHYPKANTTIGLYNESSAAPLFLVQLDMLTGEMTKLDSSDFSDDGLNNDG